MNDLLTISEVATRTGVAPSALRYYERRGLIRPAGRTGGKRTYRPEVLHQLAIIDLFRQVGFTLAEIAEITDADGNIDRAWRDVAHGRLAELQAQLTFVQRATTLIEHSLLCDHPSLNDCPIFQRSVAAHARTMSHRVDPDTV